MVFVPWREMGICPFHAMHKTDCKYGDSCRWRHPPEDEMRRLWDFYDAEESMGRTVERGDAVGTRRSDDAENAAVGYPGGGYGGWNAPMLPHGIGFEAPGEASSFGPPGWTRDDAYCAFRPPPPIIPPESSFRPSYDGNPEYSFLGAAHHQPPPLPPRPPGPPPLTRELSHWAPDFGERFDDIRPSSSGTISIPPHVYSESSYPRGYSSSPAPGAFTSPTFPHPPWPPQHPESQHHAPSFQTPPDIEPKVDKSTGQPFNPALSSNPFINGSLAYRFVWGDPLCVRCGYTGHLPKKCKGEPLSHLEQNYLYQLMRVEQNRSKAERGVDLWAPTKHLAPEPENHPDAEQEPESEVVAGLDGQASMLDAPMSPTNHNEEEARDGVLELERMQQARLQQIAMREDETMSVSSEKPHKQKSKGGKKKAKIDDEKEKREVRVEKGEKPDNPDAKPVARKKFSRELDLQPYGQPRLFTPNTPPAAKASVPSNLLPGLTMGATKRLSNGEAKSVGPHPSTIRVSAPYITQSAIEKRLQPSSLDAQERSLAEAREDSVRLQGVTWLDNVRRALQLPVKTFTTACVYYHKFRLAHPAVEYSWSDAAAASLLTSCKNEDTLKKSRDILAAAYNLKQPGSHEQVGADDPIFEAPSRVVIGLERLVLESGGFDFRSRSPHQAIIKIGKSLPESRDLKAVSKLAWTILTDLHRTFAPLKQTSATLALASLELAAHFEATKSDDNTCTVKDDLQALDLNKWHTTREEVMETLLDALDLYTHNTGSTILGTKYSLDDLLRIRLAFNKECSDSNLPRYTVVQPPPSPDNTNGTGSTLRVANGHPTPVSPPQAGTQAPPQQNGAASIHPAPEGGGTLRFMLDPQRATDERTQVNRYYTEEWEEYEEEIEVPIPRNHSRERDRRDRDRDGRPPRDHDDRRRPQDDRSPLQARGERERIRESLADREREAERERARLRDRERERRYDDRRYEDRERDRDRRYDDRREGHRDRRYYEDERRRPRDERR